LYPACAEELYSDVVIKLCNYSFILVLYGFVPLETGIARDSLFLGLSWRCRESGFHSRKFGSFQLEKRHRKNSMFADRVKGYKCIIIKNEAQQRELYVLSANNAKTRSNTRHDFDVENPCGKKTRAPIGNLHYDERVTTHGIQ
jgi:hypothetical protein